jgi:hypothetical protein
MKFLGHTDIVLNPPDRPIYPTATATSGTRPLSLQSIMTSSAQAIRTRSGSLTPMSRSAHAIFTALCVAIGSGFALALGTRSWIAAAIVGVIVVVGIGATADERIRRHRSRPPRRALVELGHKDRPPHG